MYNNESNGCLVLVIVSRNSLVSFTRHQTFRYCVAIDAYITQKVDLGVPLERHDAMGHESLSCSIHWNPYLVK